MSSDAPIWLMDVDGVLNRFGGLELPGPELRTFKSGLGYVITYDVDLLKRIADLHESGRVQLRWLTTWLEEADRHLAEELGLPRSLPVEGVESYRRVRRFSDYSWWKLEPAQQVFETGARVIWTDDDLVYNPEAMEWAQDQEPERLLFHAPNMSIGLTHEFLDRVEAWL